MNSKLHLPAAILEPMLYMTLRSSSQIDGILAETSSLRSQNVYVVASTDGRRCSVEFLPWTTRQTQRKAFVEERESRGLSARRPFINQRLSASNTWIYGLLEACAGIRKLNDDELYQATLLLPDLTTTYAAVTLEHSHNQRQLLSQARRAYFAK